VRAIPPKFGEAKFFGWRQRKFRTDLKDLSDNTLEDIGFMLARRDLNAVKPFWLA
jgi:uncharacterized protein YjiS (DUF1127 family)